MRWGACKLQGRICRPRSERLAEVRSSSCFFSQDDNPDKKKQKGSVRPVADSGSDDGSSSECSMESVSRHTSLLKDKLAAVISFGFQEYACTCLLRHAPHLLINSRWSLLCLHKD